MAVKLYKPAKKRISDKWVGSTLKLALHGNDPRYKSIDECVLVKIEGDGDDARATFRDAAGMEWQAYRFRGRWAYGSSANRVSVVND